MDKQVAFGFVWAAIDGEGSFMVKLNTDVRVLRKGRPSLSVTPRMEIENTCELFIDRFEQALRALEISPSFRLHRNFRSYDKLAYFKRYGFAPTEDSVLGGGKNYYRLAIVAREEMRRLLDMFKDEWTCKAQAALILSEVLTRIGDVPQYRATREDIEAAERLHALQGRRRRPFPTAKWQACLNGDWASYQAAKGELTPCQAEGNDSSLYLGRRRGQGVRKS